jgi:hypothetical protein
MCCFNWRTREVCFRKFGKHERFRPEGRFRGLWLATELSLSVKENLSHANIALQETLGFKKLGEKSHAHFEMDIHSRTAGLGERRTAGV